MKRVTIEELERADGKEGRPAWVCYEGKVYDVSASELWTGGRHMNSHQAGAILTKFVESAPHDDEVFRRVELVGELEPEERAAEKADEKTSEKADEKAVETTPVKIEKPPELLGKLLDRHPHPVSVHFPVALCITAALFIVLGLLFSSEHLQVAARYNLCVAILAAPVAMCTGYLSWRYNYQGRRSGFFIAKIVLSILFLSLLCAALLIRILAVEGDRGGSDWYWTYNFIVLLLAPNVMALGYLGGRITFPR